MELQNREWKEFKIDTIFTVYTGALVPKDILNKGKRPRVTATDNNNGIIGFYNDVEHKNYRKYSNFISISFLGSVFYHPYTASLDMKIHAVKLINIELNRYIGEFLVFVLKRMAENSSYGNQLSSKDLARKKILLPINHEGAPDFAYMEEYMRNVESSKKVSIKKFIQHRIMHLGQPKELEELSEKKWKEFKLTEIFTNIKRGRRLKKDNHIFGPMPYISSTASNNGVDGFVGNNIGVRIFKNCLTIANSGSVGSTFYHPYSFVASDHVTKLENDSFNKYVYLFIAHLTSRLAEKYSFNREINDTRIEKEKILLPVNSDDEPDYFYMENYIKKLELEKLKNYFQK